jgi:hypothetical protein
MRPPISAQARGALRVLWSDLARKAALVRQAVAAVPPAMAAAAVRKGVGSTSAMMRVAARIPLPILTHARQRCVWRFLEPHPEEPPALTVMAVLAGAADRPALVIESFGMAASRHALARLFDETAGQADLVAAIIEGHNYLCALPPIEGEKVFALRNVTLPAADGAFLLEGRGRDASGLPMVFCKTWVSRDQFHFGQECDHAAWANFIASVI